MTYMHLVGFWPRWSNWTTYPADDESKAQVYPSALTAAFTIIMSRVLDIKPAHNDDDPDFASIHRTMCLDGVQSLQLAHMYRLNASPPDNLTRARHFSAVTSLNITCAGAPAPALATLLSWPRTLHTLEIFSNLDEKNGMTRYARGAGNFSVGGLMQALVPQKENLAHITYRATYDHVNAHAHDTVPDFTGFSRLETLNLPLDFMWEESWDDEPELNDNDWIPADLSQTLPPSLKELVLDVASSGHGFVWIDYGEDANDPPQESKASRELFEWLSTLPTSRQSALANERPMSVRINLENGNPPRGPLDCKHTRAVRKEFEKRGIALTWSHEGFAH